MQIKALQAIVIRNPVTGDLMSIAYGTVADVPDGLGNMLIDDGIAEAYSGGGGSQRATMIPEQEFTADREVKGIFVGKCGLDAPLSNTITVTFDGKAYEVTKTGNSWGDMDEEAEMPSFNRYPFYIFLSVGDAANVNITVQDNKAHTIEITGELEPAFPFGTFTIFENGKYGVRNYAEVEVTVESFEPSGTYYIDKNGTFDVKNYAEVQVAVEPTVGFSTITLVNNTSRSFSVQDAYYYKGIVHVQDVAVNANGSKTIHVPTYGSGVSTVLNVKYDMQGYADNLSVAASDGTSAHVIAVVENRSALLSVFNSHANPTVTLSLKS